MSPAYAYSSTDATTGVTWHRWTSSGTVTGTLTDCTDGVWVPWTTTYGTTASNTTVTSHANNACWATWNDNDTFFNDCTVHRDTQTAWVRWTEVRGVGATTVARVRANTAPAVRTAEEVAAWERQVAESRRKQEEYARKATKAKQRAERLLLELLDPEQTKQYRKDKRFHVIAANGERYEVDGNHAHGNIHRVDEKGKYVEKLCVPLSQEFSESYPTADHIVAQLLALRFNIDHMLQKANRSLILPNGDRRMLPRQA